MVCVQDTLEYRKKMRLLKVRMLDGAIKSIMVDDSQIVSNMMVIICTKIGITNHDEYSLVREKTEDEENQTPNKKYGTLGTIGGTLTLKRKHKNPDSDEPQVDPKMATLRKNLHTEDGGETSYFLLSHWGSVPPSPEMASRRKPAGLRSLGFLTIDLCGISGPMSEATRDGPVVSEMVWSRHRVRHRSVPVLMLVVTSLYFS